MASYTRILPDRMARFDWCSGCWTPYRPLQGSPGGCSLRCVIASSSSWAASDTILLIMPVSSFFLFSLAHHRKGLPRRKQKEASAAGYVGESRAVISSVVISQPKRSMFSFKRASELVFGITMVPFCKHQRRQIWAAVRWYLLAMSRMVEL